VFCSENIRFADCERAQLTFSVSSANRAANPKGFVDEAARNADCFGDLADRVALGSQRVTVWGSRAAAVASTLYNSL
jgi:hypothetical protein